MILNLYPVKNFETLSQLRTLILHDLYKGKEIDIYAYIYHLLANCIRNKKSRITLPFPELIMSIMHREGVKFASSLLVMKREDPISAQTMTRSKARLPSTKGEAGGEGA